YLTLGYLDIREFYKIHPLENRSVRDASALLGRQLSPVLNWDIGADFERQTFAVGDTSTNVINAITSLHWRLGQRFGLRFIYAHSTQSNGGYHENQIGVTASYAILQGSQQALQPESLPTEPPTLTPGALPGSPPRLL